MRHFEALTRIALPSRREEDAIERVHARAAGHGFELRQIALDRDRARRDRRPGLRRLLRVGANASIVVLSVLAVVLDALWKRSRDRRSAETAAGPT